MKTIVNYLDKLKEMNGSDYRTAKNLKITRESVSQIRKRGTVSDETALKMAKLLNIEDEELLIVATIARSHGMVKEAWVKLGEKTGIAASLLIGLGKINPALFRGTEELYRGVLCILC